MCSILHFILQLTIFEIIYLWISPNFNEQYFGPSEKEDNKNFQKSCLTFPVVHYIFTAKKLVFTFHQWQTSTQNFGTDILKQLYRVVTTGSSVHNIQRSAKFI